MGPASSRPKATNDSGTFLMAGKIAFPANSRPRYSDPEVAAMDTASWLALAGQVLVLGTWIRYMSTIPSGNVPVRPIGSVLAQLLGMGLVVAALVVSYRSGIEPGAAVIVPAVLSLAMGSFFLWLLTQRKTPIGDLRVASGDPILPFEATTSEGAAFHTDELAGKRTLLKFFRGGW